MRSFVFYLSLLSSVFLQGQSFEGFLSDQDNTPIEGAYIHHLRSDEHTHSSVKGRFILKNVLKGDTLEITHLGFEKKRVTVEFTDRPLQIQLTPKAISLGEVLISPKIDALNLFTNIDIQVAPVASSQDILRQVPGLFIGQHAGGGKAEQIFLRGFDIDHGTDITITVDGMPVNMVSHAHGQGYADLHFLIPETIDKIDFGKGSYYADKGNFNTAGFVDFKTKTGLDQSQIKMEVGQFNTQRLLGMFKVLDQSKHKAYIAAESLSSDGPFESSQHFKRVNLMAKYSGTINSNDRMSVLASYFKSSWDASGQIPQRAVDAGLISRFGAIDDTEGGTTGRTNLLLSYDKYIDNETFIKNSIYYSAYDFQLFSNFTFFLNDSLNADQIRQKESRSIYGMSSELNRLFSWGETEGLLQVGLSLRNDEVLENELSRTANRLETMSRIAFGDVNETNLGAYVNASFDIGRWTINPALRVDYFTFDYYDALLPTYSTQSVSSSIMSPKLNVLYNPSNDLQLYAKTGRGFHSNDTRVVVAQNGREILPAAYSSDLGFIWKPVDRMIVNMAVWNLFLEQEFVYVGDEGIVEPSGRSNRRGTDLSLRYQPLDWLYLDFDANYTYARSIDEEAGNDRIPLAPDFTMVGGVTVKHASGWYGTVNVRYLKDRPANEDNSIVATGYTVVDFNTGFRWKDLDLGIQIQNLLNTEWNETQFATESRLRNETDPVEEIHFTPGTPFFLKGNISYFF